MNDAVTWRDGVHITGTSVWCDARRTQDLCFLSHGRLVVRGQHRQLLCTSRTLQLLSSSGKKLPGEALLTPFSRPFCLGPSRFELFPSAYLPGAASLLVTLGQGQHGQRVVYAGPVNPQAGPLPETMQVRAAEAVVCEAPLASLLRPLPSHAEAQALLLRDVERIRSDGKVALCLAGPALGAAQEIVRLLCESAAPVHVHPRIFGYLGLYESLGIDLGFSQNPPRCFLLRRLARPGEVIVWPFPEGGSLPPPARLVEAGASARLLLCAGATLSEEAVLRCRRDLGEAIPFSGAVPFPDGLDLPSLQRYVEDTGARDLYLTAGYSEKVAQIFAKKRVRVHPLGPPRQLALFAE